MDSPLILEILFKLEKLEQKHKNIIKYNIKCLFDQNQINIDFNTLFELSYKLFIHIII